MDRFLLKDQVAVVTGGGRGIGAACATLLAEAGARVAVLDVDTAGAEARATAIRRNGGRALGIGCDVSDASAVEGAFARVVTEFGGLQVLVNNAGIAVRVPATEVALEDWRKVIEVNLTAVFACARTAARHMQSHGGGAIVNIASIMGLSGGIYPNASYQASKGGVVNLTRALALEWAAQGVRVNAVAPTFVRTALTEAVFSDPERSAAVMANTPLGLLPEPEDIAAAVLYLASPAARCVTGIVLPVDSGYLAR